MSSDEFNPTPGTLNPFAVQPEAPQRREPKPDDLTTGAGQEVAPTPPSSSDTVAIPGQRIAGYEIRGLLGRGGMGEVYHAWQIDLKRPVALKMIRPNGEVTSSDRLRFRREAAAIARCQHPNIVQIHDIGEVDGQAFFSLEYVDGGSLRERIGGTPQPPREAAALMETLARALHFAHQHGIIHRDLKPANILLTRNGVPKIADFGLVKLLRSDGARRRSGFWPARGGALSENDARLETEPDAILGTPPYMAPELAARKPSAAGPRSEVYALGALLYELLTGQPPFKGATIRDTLDLVQYQEVVPPRRMQPGIPRDLETICLKCLHKHSWRRFSTAEELADDLRRFLQGEPIQARPVTLPERAWLWCRRRPARASLLAVILLAFLALLTTSWWFTCQLNRELEEKTAAHQSALAAEHRLQEALAFQVAERIDNDLRLLASFPETMSVVLADRSDWTPEHLEQWLQAALKQQPRLAGIAVAWEPSPAGEREGYGLVAERLADGALKTNRFAEDSGFRSGDWYLGPQRQLQGQWTEPWRPRVFKELPPLVTYSVPILREGKFVGVVTVGITSAYFDKIRTCLAELVPGEPYWCYLISARGTFLYHPDPAHAFPSPNATLDSLPCDAGSRPLLQQLIQKVRGREEGADVTTGKRVRYQFARVPSTDWTFFLVIPQ